MSKESSLPDPRGFSPPLRAVFQPLQVASFAGETSNKALLESHGMTVAIIDEDGRASKKRKLSPPRPPILTQVTSTESGSSGPVSERSCHALQPVLFTPTPTASLSGGRNVYQYHLPPPTLRELLNSMERYDIPSKIYRNPYYSKEADAPEKPREYAGLVFHLKGGDGIGNLEEWQGHDSRPSRDASSSRLDRTGVGGWEFASVPPSVREVRKWLRDEKNRLDHGQPHKNSSQVAFPLGSNMLSYTSKRSMAPHNLILMG